MTIFNILFFTVIAMIILSFLKPELRLNKNFNYILAGAEGSLGIIYLLTGLTFGNIPFLIFGALWLFFAYQAYKRAESLP